MNARYRLVESIGQGGMGRVWRAVDEILDRLVAVKEIRIDGSDAEDIRTRRERTLREGRATARIDHPNVVRVYDVVDEGERLWIVMELVPGRSLERIMAEEGPLGPRETARIGLGLVAALRQVHARGVLHRDIKPGNVLVEAGTAGAGRVVLTDFGIAAIQDATALTMVGMLVGSPDYMAPERISGRRQGPPSDLWSLGATLCAALAGHSPFSRDTTLATLHAVLYEEPELPTSPGPLRALLAALLSKDPATRPTLTALETTLHLIANPPPPPTLPAAPTPPSPEHTPTTAHPPAPTPAATVSTREQPEPGPTSPEDGDPGADAELRAGAGAGGSGTAPGPAGAEATVAAPPRPEGPEPQPTRAEEAQTEAPRPAPGQPEDDAPDAVAQRQLTAQSTAAVGAGVDGGGRRSGSSSAAGEGNAGWEASGPGTAAVEPHAPGGAGVDGDGRRSGSSSAAGEGNAGWEASGPGTAAVEPHAPKGAGVDGGGPRAGSPSAAGAEGAARRDASAPGGTAAVPGDPEAPGAERLGRRVPGPEAAGAVTGGVGAPTQPAGPHRRRTALLAALGVVAVGVVVAVLLAASGGAGRRGAAHGATGSAASRGGSSAAASQAGPDASTASPSATPTGSTGVSPTADGTGTPTGAPPGGRVEAGGFAWVPPRGWRRDVKTGAEVHYTSPDGRQELVAKSSLARGDLWGTWQQSERDARQGRDYVRVRLARTSFQGYPAVVWEYTFTLKGTPWHARLLGFDADGKSYQVNTWYQPEIETRAEQTYSTVKETFTVL